MDPSPQKLYYHGEPLNVNVHVTNNSTKTIKKIKVSGKRGDRRGIEGGFGGAHAAPGHVGPRDTPQNKMQPGVGGVSQWGSSLSFLHGCFTTPSPYSETVR